MNRPLALAAFGVAALVAAPAVAGSPPTRSVSERIYYADLDLASPDGARAMLHRLQAASSRACAQPRSKLLPRAQTEAFKCRHAALARAVAKLRQPMVSAEYARLVGEQTTQTAAR